MEVKAFFTLVVPFICVMYLAAPLLIRPPRAVWLASLLGGLVMALLNMLFDIIAYYAYWWHYALNDLIWHLPLPFYVTPFLILGSAVYMIIWRFWHTRRHWLALLLLFGVPALGIVRDLFLGQSNRGYAVWDSNLAAPMVIVMWVIMFYAGYFVFQRLAPARSTLEQENSAFSS